MVHLEACLIDVVFQHPIQLSLYRVFDRLHLRSCIAVFTRGRGLVLPDCTVNIPRDDGAAVEIGLCLDVVREVDGPTGYDGAGINSVRDHTSYDFNICACLQRCNDGTCHLFATIVLLVI